MGRWARSEVVKVDGLGVRCRMLDGTAEHTRNTDLNCRELSSLKVDTNNKRPVAASFLSRL